ncbi:hypothetical protein LIPSTDRAFT_103968 [Lipomyces starkeyi NRRL Y-11557]|uniref:Uncharacterized protein n=1 Tax=Lipomyces starkeyi NRRL Y-11557 TaxID=675824 RepID=A0A1E3Q760_LIPST|nr:hypothetical protein LIPSTDRAFT_103968 [Lipomyces starkeyi NRRL Y-11557]
MATANLGTSLTIGGTGMLASATHWLAARSERTIVVARQAGRFTHGDVRLVPVIADWMRPIRKVGPIRQITSDILLWLHNPEALIPLLLPLIGTGRVILPAAPPAIAPCTTVRLASTNTASGRRWLTDIEIGEGAIAALQDGHSRIVGDLVGLD